MQGSPNIEKITPPKDGATATRWCVNHNWCFRGDNTKYKGKK